MCHKIVRLTQLSSGFTFLHITRDDFRSASILVLYWIPRNQIYLRRVWRYQRDNHNPYIEKEQTTQWPKEKVQKDKQRSTKHTYKTKDRVTRTPLKTGVELRCSGRVSSSCSTSDIRMKIPLLWDFYIKWTLQICIGKC